MIGPDTRCEACRCGRIPSEPCEPCKLLMESDAFSGVDARHDNYPTDRDPYEVYMGRGEAEER